MNVLSLGSASYWQSERARIIILRVQLRLHFLEASGSLAPWRNTMRAQAKQIAQLVDRHTDRAVRRGIVDVLIQRSAAGAISEIGMGGASFKKSLVTIYVDPENENFRASLEKGEFAPTLAHELHHALRIGTCGYGTTLGESLVTEGLADAFSQELTGCDDPMWTQALGEAEWPEMLDRAEKELDSTTYDHAQWFYGTGALPRWAGYAIGYRLVQRYKQAVPGARAGALVGTIAAEIIEQAWPLLRSNSPA
jgi:uncharacterized protein YjaZ